MSKTGRSKFTAFLEMIKIEHSIFALPFAYLGILLSRRRFLFNRDLFWVTVAMVSARTFAMSFNRYVDREIDARNPRTKNRALPQKLLTEKEVLLFTYSAILIFILSAYMLSPMCRYFWPILLLPMIIYSYTKKFTYFCHFILGISLGLSPIGTWIAVTNTIPPLKVILLGMAIMFWTAGFDIIYACQDIDFDRKEGLFSIPSRFGISTALKVTSLLHVITIILLLLTGFLFQLQIFYFLGVLTVASILWYENHIVKPSDLSRVNVAFFTTNGVVSILIFVFTWLDLYFTK
ncbi:UbiA family prenyltransferase [Candidatus Desantisbacteria bacterium]|nr:UbiA family prenyltransferase [Candidatus Desantisbacteria bacterium]